MFIVLTLLLMWMYVQSRNKVLDHQRFFSLKRPNRPCWGPCLGRLGLTPAPDFDICSSKCLLVGGYCIDITQLYLVSQPETETQHLLFLWSEKMVFLTLRYLLLISLSSRVSNSCALFILYFFGTVSEMGLTMQGYVSFDLRQKVTSGDPLQLNCFPQNSILWSVFTTFLSIC